MTEIEAKILALTIQIQYKLLNETTFVVNNLSEKQQEIHYENLLHWEKQMDVWTG